MTPLVHDSLTSWLTHLETLHSQTIELGLERVRRVQTQMQLIPHCPVIVVGGTNGKGSVCAMLTAILSRAGYRVGTYTSPHLLHYNERVALDGKPVSDATLCQSFAAVEVGRGEVSLSYFEFGTLAAVHTFMTQAVDVMVLEVGLGGRLDAVNLFDADCSVIVSVDLDHQDWLGDTREAIGYEKAGIMRAGRPAICADADPPASLLAHANSLGVPLQCIGRDFSYTHRDPVQWNFQHGATRHHSLPYPALRGAYQLQNASAALAALDALHDQLPVGMGDIRRGLLELEWPGRFQVLPGRPLTILDVGHNPHAVRAMVASLNTLGYAERRFAVFSMLDDKDIASVVVLAREQFDHWFIAPLATSRAVTIEALSTILNAQGVQQFSVYADIAAADQAALAKAAENDRIVVFGSFYTVAAVLEHRKLIH